ncbi:TlpA family protein disulfide reductase [Spiractinospora alimapuensis]|nr:TlpA family protein disulfide reductase [Spiractinospora alimapuensis]
MSSLHGASGRKVLSVVAVSCALLLAGCGGTDDAQSAASDTRYVEGDGAATAFDIDERVDAPDVSGESLDGEPVALDDYAGEVLVVNFWASWCAPCRAEKPVLDEVLTEYGDDGLNILGVNIKDNETAANQFAESFDLAYPSLFDQPGQVPQAFRDTVPPQAIPSTLILDREGRIAGRVIGQVDYTTLTDLVEPVLDEGESSS